MKPFTSVVAILLLAGLAQAHDLAVIELGVETQNASAGLAMQAADAVSRRILATLLSNGVDKKDIQTTFLSLQPQSSHRKGVRITWFIAEQTLSVTVRDLTKLDALLEALLKSGVNRIDSISYETSDLRKYRDQARDLAAKAAREKGEALAKALGQTIGKAQAIEELPEPRYSAGLANVSYETWSPTKSGPTLAAGQQSIQASVVVSFELM